MWAAAPWKRCCRAGPPLPPACVSCASGAPSRRWDAGGAGLGGGTAQHGAWAAAHAHSMQAANRPCRPCPEPALPPLLLPPLQEDVWAVAPHARLNPPYDANGRSAEGMPEDEDLGPPASFFADSGARGRRPAPGSSLVLVLHAAASPAFRVLPVDLACAIEPISCAAAGRPPAVSGSARSSRQGHRWLSAAQHSIPKHLPGQWNCMAWNCVASTTLVQLSGRPLQGGDAARAAAAGGGRPPYAGASILLALSRYLSRVIPARARKAAAPPRPRRLHAVAKCASEGDPPKACAFPTPFASPLILTPRPTQPDEATHGCCALCAPKHVCAARRGRQRQRAAGGPCGEPLSAPCAMIPAGAR